MNRGSIISEVRRVCKDTSGDPALQKWTDSILQTRVNSVQEEMVAATGCLESRSTDTDVVSGTAEYIIPITLLAVRQVLIEQSGGEYLPITFTSEQDLNRRDSNWRDTSGTPTEYYLSRGYVGLYPKPDYSRTGGLRVDGLMKAVDMTSDADVPFNSDYRFYAAHMGIVYGVSRLCMMDDSKWNEAQSFQALYTQNMNLIKSLMTDENVDSRISNVYEAGYRAMPRRTR